MRPLQVCGSCMNYAKVPANMRPGPIVYGGGCDICRHSGLTVHRVTLEYILKLINKETSND